MNFKKAIYSAVVFFGITCTANIVSADTITAMIDEGGGKYSNTDNATRYAWLTTATSGFSVGAINGTPGASDVASLFGGTWLNEGSLTAVGTNDLFTVSLTSGTWGEGPLTGTWSLNSSFYTVYSTAIITMHVGNGASNPDWFFWEVAPTQTSGNFHYNRISGGGGGLSNMFLWGGGTPQVPDSGMTVIFLGLGLLSLALVRRKSA